MKFRKSIYLFYYSLWLFVCFCNSRTVLNIFQQRRKKSLPIAQSRWMHFHQAENLQKLQFKGLRFVWDSSAILQETDSVLKAHFKSCREKRRRPTISHFLNFLPSVTLVQSISRNPAGLCRRSRWELEKKKQKSTGEQIDKLISGRDECDFVFPLAADRWRLQRMRGGKKERQKKKKKKWPPLTELQRNSSLYIRNAL